MEQDTNLELISIQNRLQMAVELELATIPPYLTAIWSINGDDTESKEAKNIIRSVFMEEMLHMVLASNLLISIGGKVELSNRIVEIPSKEKFEITHIPSYPLDMSFENDQKIEGFSDRNFQVHLRKYSSSNLITFLKIELPDYRKEKIQPLYQLGSDNNAIKSEEYTIGRFYSKIYEDVLRIKMKQTKDLILNLQKSNNDELAVLLKEYCKLNLYMFTSRVQKWNILYSDLIAEKDLEDFFNILLKGSNVEENQLEEIEFDFDYKKQMKIKNDEVDEILSRIKNICTSGNDITSLSLIDDLNFNLEGQLTPDYFWQGRGEIVVVENIDDFKEAIDLIVEQGEGAEFKAEEIAESHFGKFAKLLCVLYDDIEYPSTHNEWLEFMIAIDCIIVDVSGNLSVNKEKLEKMYQKFDINSSGDLEFVNKFRKLQPKKLEQIFNIVPNSKKEIYKKYNDLERLNNEFNFHYTLMLKQLEEGFNGNPKSFYTAIMNGMHKLTPLAKAMMQIEFESKGKKYCGAPSFEWNEDLYF